MPDRETLFAHPTPAHGRGPIHSNNGLSKLVALVGLVSFGLGAGGGLLAVGAAQGSRDARIATLEETGRAARGDHDDLTTLKAVVADIAKKVDGFDGKLDRLIQAAHK